MVHRVRRVGVEQMAKMLGALYLLLGIVFAAIFAVIGAMVPMAGAGEDATMFGPGFLIAMPFLYGLLGLVFGALVAWLYNIVAGWTGGIELELS